MKWTVIVVAAANSCPPPKYTCTTNFVTKRSRAGRQTDGRTDSTDAQAPATKQRPCSNFFSLLCSPSPSSSCSCLSVLFLPALPAPLLCCGIHFPLLNTTIFLLNYHTYTSRGWYTQHRFSSLTLVAGLRPQGGKQVAVVVETRHKEGGGTTTAKTVVVTATTVVEEWGERRWSTGHGGLRRSSRGLTRHFCRLGVR